MVELWDELSQIEIIWIKNYFSSFRLSSMQFLQRQYTKTPLWHITAGFHSTYFTWTSKWLKNIVTKIPLREHEEWRETMCQMYFAYKFKSVSYVQITYLLHLIIDYSGAVYYCCTVEYRQTSLLLLSIIAFIYWLICIWVFI